MRTTLVLVVACVLVVGCALCVGDGSARPLIGGDVSYAAPDSVGTTCELGPGWHTGGGGGEYKPGLWARLREFFVDAGVGMSYGAPWLNGGYENGPSRYD
jgi:hypothetical protein